MAGKGKKSPTFGALPAAQLRRLAEALGYDSSPARSELIRRLSGREDFPARLAGLVASLSRNARELFHKFAGKKVPLAVIKKGAGLDSKAAVTALAELEEKGLAGLKSKDEYEFAGKPPDFPRPGSKVAKDVRFSAQRFLMDLVRLVQLVRQRELRVLSDGSPGVRFLNKLEAVLRVEGDREDDGRFVDYMNVLFRIAVETGLIEVKDKILKVARQADDFFKLPLHTRIQELFEAWLRCKGVNEPAYSDRLRFKGKPAPNTNDIPDNNRLCSARRSLADCLSFFGGNRWYPLDGLVYFCRTKAPDMLVKSVPDGRAAELNLVYRGIFARNGTDHNEGLPRAGNWHRVEGEYIRMAMWILTAIGVVEVSEDGAWFRLTPEGRYCLGISPEPVCSGNEGRCLVVQPNFEVVVFQANATPDVLHTLGMFADLVAGRENPVYQMSQESVYRSAKEGLSLDELLCFLERHSTTGIPANVSSTLEEWWTRCNTVYFEEYCDVIELPADRPELASLLANGNGTRMRNGRLLVLPGGMPSPPKTIRVLDHRNRGKCAEIDSEGVITVDLEAADVFVPHELEKFASLEEQDGKVLRFRPDLEAFGKMDEEVFGRTLEFLETVCGELPPEPAFRILSARGNGAVVKVGEIKAVSLSGDTRRLKLAEALFGPHAVGKLGDYWLLPADKWKKVEKRLRELGIKADKAGRELKAASAASGSNGEESQHPAKIVEVLKRAMEREHFVELTYALPNGRGKFVVKPIDIVANGSGEAVEAYDPKRGGNILLTLSNIESVKRLVRRPAKRL